MLNYTQFLTEQVKDCMVKFSLKDFRKSDENIYIFTDRLPFDPVLHTHDFIELVYALSGTGVHEINGVEYEVKKGDLLFIDVGQTHRFTSTRGRLYVNIMIHPRFISSELVGHDNVMDFLSLSLFDEFQGYVAAGRPVVSFQRGDSAEVEFIVKRMIHEFEKKQIGYRAIINSYMKVLFAKMFREMNNGAKRDAAALPPEAIQYIDEHYFEKLSLQKLAEKTYYNPSYFCRLFKRTYGKSLTRYIQEKRVQEASRLLIDTDLPVEEICHKVGYADKGTFYNVFKAQQSLTPKAFRLKHQKK